MVNLLFFSNDGIFIRRDFPIFLSVTTSRSDNIHFDSNFALIAYPA